MRNKEWRGVSCGGGCTGIWRVYTVERYVGLAVKTPGGLSADLRPDIATRPFTVQEAAADNAKRRRRRTDGTGLRAIRCKMQETLQKAP